MKVRSHTTPNKLISKLPRDRAPLSLMLSSFLLLLNAVFFEGRKPLERAGAGQEGSSALQFRVSFSWSAFFFMNRL